MKIFSFSCFIMVFFNVLVLIKYFSDLNFVMLKFHLKLPQAKKFKYLFCSWVMGRWSFSRVVKSKSSGTLIFNYPSANFTKKEPLAVQIHNVWQLSMKSTLIRSPDGDVIGHFFRDNVEEILWCCLSLNFYIVLIQEVFFVWGTQDPNNGKSLACVKVYFRLNRFCDFFFFRRDSP